MEKFVVISSKPVSENCQEVTVDLAAKPLSDCNLDIKIKKRKFKNSGKEGIMYFMVISLEDAVNRLQQYNFKYNLYETNRYQIQTNVEFGLMFDGLDIKTLSVIGEEPVIC